MVTDTSSDEQREVKEANTCIALGAGVGALGATAAAITGVVCPLCIFIAPGLVGVGVVKKIRDRRRRTLANEALRKVKEQKL